eukprot:TRINITY_DN58429_c0_g1_i1.p1 TRINITY_DN58429_c0_g1~~TRINITY_DN58429_c0_g1_i1.p1  ORF type:complete len:325 (-),score=49.55 TRINITY_DN58429_c0_g1_i1:494-1468(-)
MEELAGDTKYKGRVNFFMINCQGIDDAKKYAHANGLNECPHGAGPVPGSYGVRYIPHKTLIGKDGKIIKNYEGFQWSDIDDALAASGGYAAIDDSAGRKAKHIAETFAKFDANGDGLIDRRELAVLLDKVGLSMDVDEVINKADSDGNGRLDYAEFSAWICSADSGRLRRALGLASTGPDGGLPQCANFCGRAPFRHHKTCCTHCKGPKGPHAHACDKAAGEAEELSIGPKCRNGCGRDPFGDYPTCCTHCTGADGPHSRSCNAAATRPGGGGGRPADSPRAGSVTALSKILGEELLRGDGKKVQTAAALSRCKVVGILFTAMW